MASLRSARTAARERAVTIFCVASRCLERCSWESVPRASEKYLLSSSTCRDEDRLHPGGQAMDAPQEAGLSSCSFL